MVEVAAASVIGRDHRRADRPCQDAFAIRRGAAATVVVLADGCGSGAHSELGARLGANLLANALSARLAAGARADERATWRAACDEVLARLAELVPVLGDDPISRHLLFTLVAAALTDDGAAVLTIGDGLVAIDGELRVLESADNAPAYLGYELLGRAVAIELEVVSAAGALALATDGAAPLAGELAAMPRDDRFFTHPDALRRRLARASREEIEIDWERGEVVRRGGLLADVTTVALVRRDFASREGRS